MWHGLKYTTHALSGSLYSAVPAVGESALEARKMTKESTEGESSDIDKDGSEVLSGECAVRKTVEPLHVTDQHTLTCSRDSKTRRTL